MVFVESLYKNHYIDFRLSSQAGGIALMKLTVYVSVVISLHASIVRLIFASRFSADVVSVCFSFSHFARYSLLNGSMMPTSNGWHTAVLFSGSAAIVQQASLASKCCEVWETWHYRLSSTNTEG